MCRMCRYYKLYIPVSCTYVICLLCPGICRQAGERELTAGLNRVQLMLQDCPGFDGFVYDAYTGWNTISRIIIEEVVPCELTNLHS